MSGWLIGLCILAAFILGGTFVYLVIRAAWEQFWKELGNK